MLFLATWLAIAGVPLAAFAALLVTHAVATTPALICITGIAAAAAVIAQLWVADLSRLRHAVRRAMSETPGPAGPLPRLRHMARLAQEVARLSKNLADRAELVGRLLKTDEMIVEALPDPLIVLAADRSVRRANIAARTAFGAEQQAVLRQPGLRAAIDRAYAQGVTQQAALTLPVPVSREVVATVIPLDPPLADGGRAIILLSDRTRERAIERMRADFVANASHELRTPLASLIGFIETLRGPAQDDPPAQARFLGIMAEQADRMVAEIEPRLGERDVTLQRHISPELPPILGDTDQLAQVLTNLLDNALKYGKQHGTIRLEAEPAPATGTRWPARPGIVLSVSDDGPGIAKHHIPRLTEGRSRAVGGTGLGLAIVKHIVNRHRGQLLIESSEGKGATFHIWLPAAPAAAVRAATVHVT